MPKEMNRRQWLLRSGGALSGTFLASYGNMDIFHEEAAKSSPVRMMFNENPYGPSPTARKAMIRAFDEGNLYSGEAYNELRRLIAEQEGLTPEHVLIASGSTEILNVAGLVYGLQGGEMVTPHPTFQRLTSYGEGMGARVHRVAIDSKLGLDLEQMGREVTDGCKLVYICNPNNPTGTITPASELVPFCEKVARKCMVFVDEAYHEYVEASEYRSMIDLVRKGHQVIVSRTASKIHGLAGLRVGFGFADPGVIRKLQGKLTGTTNIIGLRAAIASYRDKGFQELSLKKALEAKQIIYDLLDETGHKYLRSETNFIFFRTGRPIREFQKLMEARGFLVGRPFPPYTDWCRLSMATPENMARFADAFREII